MLCALQNILEYEVIEKARRVAFRYSDARDRNKIREYRVAIKRHRRDWGPRVLKPTECVHS